jgi:hypothetical protein
MNTTATHTQTQTTVIAKIRNWLRQLRGGQDAMFRYDRQFQAESTQPGPSTCTSAEPRSAL